MSEKLYVEKGSSIYSLSPTETVQSGSSSDWFEDEFVETAALTTAFIGGLTLLGILIGGFILSGAGLLVTAHRSTLVNREAIGSLFRNPGALALLVMITSIILVTITAIFFKNIITALFVTGGILLGIGLIGVVIEIEKFLFGTSDSLSTLNRDLTAISKLAGLGIILSLVFSITGIFVNIFSAFVITALVFFVY